MQILQIVDKQQFLTSFDISELLTIYKRTWVFCSEWTIYPYNYISELSELKAGFSPTLQNLVKPECGAIFVKSCSFLE